MTITDDFLIRYCDESNKIERQPIPLHFGTMGHLDVLRAAVQLGSYRMPLTLETLCNWQMLIIREQIAHGYDGLPENCIGHLRPLGYEVRIGGRMGELSGIVPRSMDRFLVEIDQTIRAANFDPLPPFDDPIDLIGRFHWTYEQIHPFADGNGRTGRAVALYMAVALGVPPVLFTADDRFDTYYPAFQSPEAMVAYCRSHQVKEPVAESSPR